MASKIYIMPNWCYNKLIVKSNDDVNEFRRFMKKGLKMETIDEKEILVWRISNYLPTPQELINGSLSSDQLIMKYGFDKTCDWNNFNWGTIWDCDDYGFESKLIEDTLYELDFDSAWSPPIQWMITIASQFPGLSFKLEYVEFGTNFSGVTIIENGIFLDLCSEPLLINDFGEDIKFEFNEETNCYKLESGEIYTEDEWFEFELSNLKNPLAGLKMKMYNNQ